MHAPIQVSGLTPGATPAHRRSGKSAELAQLRRRAALPLWLVLALAAAPAPAFAGERQAQATEQAPVFDSSAMPAAANWVVLGATGTAAWRGRGETEWRQFVPGEVLPPGCEIETGPDGEVTLAAGGDQLIVAAQGRLVVPQASPGQDRRLRHERGRILIHIESRQNRDVRVKTPLLSLGIKGTVFEVDVGPEQDSVVVHDGEVEVTTPGQPDPVELGAGEGLRQPAAQDSPATRFTLPEREAPLAIPSVAGRAHTPSGSGHTEGSDAARLQAKGPFGWLDDWASSWAFAATAGLLTIFVLAMFQILRWQWSSRQGTRDRRPHEPVRGRS